ncbi:hypothetical protein FDP41_013062 [Naegleria fowleri]|uniref:Uncharacterized protein n=1 Tax=Naegleria fowleri TaxID=5763 RepID=A0A6A5C5H1_NAEFO|nr:uncharacterized protein FDP41_013062 [Naegleria fowleri]KAF0980579.1 hypothetical protein FDP41_013062 [Naegleria fowleri]
MSRAMIEPTATTTTTNDRNTHHSLLVDILTSQSNNEANINHQRSTTVTSTPPTIDPSLHPQEQEQQEQQQREEPILQVILLGDRNHIIKPAILSTQLLENDASFIECSENGNNLSSRSSNPSSQSEHQGTKLDSHNSTTRRPYHHHRGTFQVLGSAGEPNRVNSNTSLDSNSSSSSSSNTDSVVETFSPPSNGIPQIRSPKSLSNSTISPYHHHHHQHNQQHHHNKLISTLTMNFNPNAPSGNAILLFAQKQTLFESIISKKSSSLPEFTSHMHSDVLSSTTVTDCDEWSGSESGYNDSLYMTRNVNTVNIQDLIQTKKTNMLDSDFVLIEHLKKVRTRYQALSERLIESESLYNGSDENGRRISSPSNSPQMLSVTSQQSQPQMVHTLSRPTHVPLESSSSSQATTITSGTLSTLETFMKSFNSTCLEYCQEELKFLYTILSSTIETTSNHDSPSISLSFSTPSNPSSHSSHLSTSLPIYISWNSLNIDELKCSCNVLKKLSVLQHDFTITEKMFLAQNLALPDCFNYMLLDNPEKSLIEQNKAIGKHKMNYSIDSDESSPETMFPSEKKKKLFNWFGGSKKKQQQSSSTGRGNPITDKSTYLQVYIVLLEVADSHLIQIPPGSEHNLFRSAIAIGNWLLEWHECSLIVPSRKSPHGTRLNHCYHYIPLRKIEGENVEKTLIKVSNLCCLWNGNFVYDLKNCNHQHFVRDVLEMLESENLFSPLPVTATQASFVPPLPPVGITNPLLYNSTSNPIQIGNAHRDHHHHNTSETTTPIRLFGTSVEMLLHRIQRDGYSSLAFYMNDNVKEIIYGKKKKNSINKTSNSVVGSTSPKLSGVVASPPQSSSTSTRASSKSTYLTATTATTTVVSTSSSPPVMNVESSIACDMSSPQLSYINKNGISNANIFTWNEKDFITIKEHRDVDNLFFHIKNAFGPGNDYFNSFEGQWDRWLLQLFDRSFWVRVAQSKKPVDRNSKDYPLTKQNARLTLDKESLEQLCQSKHATEKGNVLVHCKEEINCPFNPEALSTVEVDLISKLADSSSLGEYEPSLPYRRHWVTPNTKINNINK